MDANYMAEQMVRFFHWLPHINISFHLVEARFEPESDLYLESLGFAASVPAAWLLLTLLVLLTYLLTRCCDSQLKRGRSLACHRWFLAITAFLCSCVVAVGLYGNDDVHNAALRLSSALRAVNETVTTVGGQSTSLRTTLEAQSFPLAEHLTELVDTKTLSNATVQQRAVQLLGAATANISAAMADLDLLRRRLEPASPLPEAQRILDLVELYRWPATMAVLSAFILFCLVLIFALVRRVRCLLVTFAVVGLLSIIINWCAASVYLASAMALGDLCTAPAEYVERLVASQYGTVIAEYYIHCPADGAVKESGPLNVLVRQARLNIDKSSLLVAEFVTLSESYYSPKDIQPALDKLSRSLKSAGQSLATLAGLVDCAPLHRRYLDINDAVCHQTMFGLTFMLGSAVAAGLLFTLLVWVDSHVWIYLRKRKGYLQVTEQDPFLPLSSSGGSSGRGGVGGGIGGGSLQRTAGLAQSAAASYSTAGTYPGRHVHYRHQHTPPQTPPFPGTLNGRGNHGHHSHHGHHHGGGRHDQPSAPPLLGPNNGQYATLSKSCKTLESSDFY